jgi:hypothetical protein
MELHAEERLLFAREMARSRRDYDHGRRLARSRTIIAESHALLETTAKLREVLATLRVATGKR